PSNTVLEELVAAAPSLPHTRLRAILGAFLFSGDAVDKKVTVLSGGEKARLALAKMLVHPAALLCLDEPTNHLDLASREVLEAALAAFPGTIVFISHDRYFINRIATEVTHVDHGRLTRYLGGYDDHLTALARAAAGLAPMHASAAVAPAPSPVPTPRRAEPVSRPAARPPSPMPAASPPAAAARAAAARRGGARIGGRGDGETGRADRTTQDDDGAARSAAPRRRHRAQDRGARATHRGDRPGAQRSTPLRQRRSGARDHARAQRGRA